MAEPTPYDKIQDQRLGEIEKVVKTDYQAGEGIEESFPNARQGITQDQFALMNLAHPPGVINGSHGVINDSDVSTGMRYHLTGHATNAATNATNTLFLRGGKSAESVVDGYYHRLNADMELSFPPVAKTTVYHVTVTRDPRDFADKPLSIRVFAGEPPTVDGQKHLVLHKVTREPNQLLTEAKREMLRPFIAGNIATVSSERFPSPRDYPAGTLATVAKPGEGLWVRSAAKTEWASVLYSDWENLRLASNMSEGTLRARKHLGGVELYGGLYTEATMKEGFVFAYMPDWWARIAGSEIYYVTGVRSTGRRGPFALRVSGTHVTLYDSEQPPGWYRFHGIVLPPP